MKWLLLLALAGCPDKSTRQTPGVVVPQGAKVLVAKDCNLWPHPPSTYFRQTIVTYDLESGTYEHSHIEGEPKPDTPEPPPVAKKTTGKIEPEKLKTIRARLADVLAGGPYPQKVPPSGGGRCTLVLHGGDPSKPYLSIDRYEPAKDAVDRLLDVL